MEQQVRKSWFSWRNPAGAVFWLVLFTSLLRLVMIANTGLGFGESYYSLSVLNPALSYFDQPPLSFWISRLSVALFGDFSALALRLPSILFFAGTCGLLFVFTRRLFGERAGFYAVLALNLSMVFSVTGACWLQPDASLMFFWLATACCILRIFFHPAATAEERQAWRCSKACLGWWLLAGLLLGLTTLSKYHAAFLFAGVALYAATRREDRHWLWHPGPYLALLINGLLALPVLIWNYQNGWASFVFQAGRAAGDGQSLTLHPEWVLQSICGQAMWLLPWVWLPLIYVLYRCIRAGRGDSARWFCACTAILPLVFFTLVTLWSNLGFHFHWQAPGYLMLFPALGMLMASIRGAGGVVAKWMTRAIYASAILTLLTVVLLKLHVETGCWTFYGPKWFAGLLGEKEDPTMEGYDYKDFYTRFEQEGWLANPNVFVFSDRWHLAGKIGWALKGRKPVLCLHWDPRNIAFFWDQKDFIGKDAILVTHEGKFVVPLEFSKCFEKIERLPDQPIVRSGVTETSFEVYYCHNLRSPFPLPYGKGVSAHPKP